MSEPNEQPAAEEDELEKFLREYDTSPRKDDADDDDDKWTV